VEVLADPVARMRYGFVASYPPGRDIDGVLRNFRRLHLTAAQCYDWGYRHADLVAPTGEYTDPLGQPISMATVRALTAGLRHGGTLPLGYAAVYGVGKQEWPDWEHLALLRPDGTPYDLGGFLSIVDPSDPAWLRHFGDDLVRSVAAGGFAGFHLDQYGFPRRAPRPDGVEVDLAVAFDTMIRSVRQRLPDACLVFNHVNDFPVWATTRSPQDVTYTEVWEPHDGLADLAAVATRSRGLAPGRPAVLAAYQSVYASQPAAVADATTRLTMATLFSHGATQLLAGEAGHVLVDPYYVRNHAAQPSTMDMLARWYDLLVAAGDLLFDPDQADLTRSVVGSLNDEVEVTGAPMWHEPRPGTVWRRVVETGHGLVVHLVNLATQTETGWDAPKEPATDVTGLRLRLRRVGASRPTVHTADPDAGPGLTARPVATDDTHHEVELPPLGAWQIVLIRYATSRSDA
jgi:dextranase